MDTKSHWPLVVLVPLLLLMTAAALPRLSESIWSDEWWSLYYIGVTDPAHTMTVPAVLERIAAENHELVPPAYYVLLAWWAQAVGPSELATRWLSLLVGLLAVAGTYRIGADGFDRETGVYAAFLLGANAFVIFYLHDMRVYTLVLLGVVVVHGVYLRVMRYAGVYFVALWAAAVSLLYIHYFAALMLAPLGVYHLWRWRADRRRLWWGIIALGLAGLLLLPWFRVTLISISSAQANIRTVTDRFTIAEALSHLAYMATNGNALIGWLLLTLALWRPHGRGFGLALVLFAGGTVILLLANQPVPILTEKRYLLHLFPSLALLMGAGLANLRGRMPIAAVTILVLWGLAAGYNVRSPQAQHKIHSRDWYPPLKPFTEALTGYATPGDTALFHLPEGSMRSNVPQLMDYYAAPLEIDGVLIPAGDATLDATYAGYVRDAVNGASRVWLGYEPGRRTYRLGAVEEQLLPELGFTQCGVLVDQPPTYAAFWSRADDAPSFTIDAVTFEQLNDLPVVRRDNRLPVAVGWQASDLPPHTYSVAIHLRDESGTVIQQADFPLTTTGFGCHLALVSVRGVPAGEYAVVVRVYNWQTGDALGEHTLAIVRLMD
jgi:hypothetical protein